MYNDPHFNISQRFFNVSQRCLAHFLLCSMPMPKRTKKIALEFTLARYLHSSNVF